MKKRKPVKTTVTFRVDAPVKRLIKKAARRDGLTPSRWMETLAMGAVVSAEALVSKVNP